MFEEENSINSIYSIEVEKRIYLIFAIACVVANIVGAASNVILFGMSLTSVVCIIFGALAIIALILAFATKRIVLIIHILTILIITFEFPILYISYREAAIPYFILGLYGATILYHGRLRIAMISILGILYTGIIIYVFVDPSYYQSVLAKAGDMTLTISTIVATTVTVATMLSTLIAVIKSYIKQNNECVELNKRLERLNHYDVLTPCYNRKFIFEYLNMNNAQNSFTGISLIMFNVPELSLLNDKYGYSYGDSLLIELSEIMFQAIKGRGLVSRFDGTKFLVILNVTFEEEINKIINEISTTFDNYTKKTKDCLFILGYGYTVCKGLFVVDDKIKEIIDLCNNHIASLKERSQANGAIYSVPGSGNNVD